MTMLQWGHELLRRFCVFPACVSVTGCYAIANTGTQLLIEPNIDCTRATYNNHSWRGFQRGVPLAMLTHCALGTGLLPNIVLKVLCLWWSHCIWSHPFHSTDTPPSVVTTYMYVYIQYCLQYNYSKGHVQCMDTLWTCRVDMWLIVPYNLAI